MKSCVCVFIMFWGLRLAAQELVPNGSFESVVDTGFRVEISNWYSPNNSSPDFLHPLNDSSVSQDGYISAPSSYMGTYYAHTGQAYAGLALIFLTPPLVMEHIQVKLLKPMTKGETYNVSFWVKPAYLFSDYFTASLGAYFSSDTILKSKGVLEMLDGEKTGYLEIMSPNLTSSISSSTDSVLSDTSWFCISGTYIASGGERYMTIGMFWEDNPVIKKMYFKAISNPGNLKNQEKLVKLIRQLAMVPNLYKQIRSSENIYFKAGFPYYLIDDVSVVENTSKER